MDGLVLAVRRVAMPARMGAFAATGSRCGGIKQTAAPAAAAYRRRIRDGGRQVYDGYLAVAAFCARRAALTHTFLFVRAPFFVCICLHVSFTRHHEHGECTPLYHCATRLLVAYNATMQKAYVTAGAALTSPAGTFRHMPYTRRLKDGMFSACPTLARRPLAATLRLRCPALPATPALRGLNATARRLFCGVSINWRII